MDGSPSGLGTNFGFRAIGAQRWGHVRLGEGLSDRLDHSGVGMAAMHEGARNKYTPGVAADPVGPGYRMGTMFDRAYGSSQSTNRI